MENQKIIEVVGCFNLLVSIIEDALTAEGENKANALGAIKKNIEIVINDIRIAYNKGKSNIFVSWISSVTFIDDIINENNENIDDFNDEVDLSYEDEDDLSVDQLMRIKIIAKSQVDNIKIVVKI